MRELFDRQRVLLLTLTVAVTLVGCEDNPSGSTPRPPPELPLVVLDTPENAARGALTYLQAELRAVANGNEQTAEEALEQLRSLVAVESIEKKLNRMPRFKTLLGDDQIKGYIHNWGSAIAYYAEGFHFDRMRRASEAPSKVAVIVPASGKEDDALIQVTCLRQDDDTWHVSRIEFVAENATSTPASRPASEP